MYDQTTSFCSQKRKISFFIPQNYPKDHLQLLHMVCFVEKVPSGTFFNKAHALLKKVPYGTFFQQSTPCAKVQTLEMCMKKNCVLAPPGLEPTISGSKHKRPIIPVGHWRSLRQGANLLILNDTGALSIINILFSQENWYLMLLSG